MFVESFMEVFNVGLGVLGALLAGFIIMAAVCIPVAIIIALFMWVTDKTEDEIGKILDKGEGE